MIRSIRHKGLRGLYRTGSSAKVRPDHHKRCLRLLDALEAATKLGDMNVPNYDVHALKSKPARYSVHVNGPWTITFEWDDDTGEALRVDLEQYH